MLIPTPLLVAEEISDIPQGTLLSVSELRSRLARKHKADFTCPLMTGIFFNLVAGAAEEELESGKKPLAPYWRVILDNGTLSPKTPDGSERQAKRLQDEGFTVTEKTGKFHVQDYKLYLVP